MSELKPCPFCGGDAKVVGCGNGMRAFECLRCGASTACTFKTDGSMRLWNARAERTCEVEGSYTDNWEYQTWGFELSCGHDVSMLVNEPPNYCPNCGAKVVVE